MEVCPTRNATLHLRHNENSQSTVTSLNALKNGQNTVTSLKGFNQKEALLNGLSDETQHTTQSESDLKTAKNGQLSNIDNTLTTHSLPVNGSLYSNILLIFFYF